MKIWKICCKTNKIALFLVLYFSLFFVALLGYLSYKPLTINTNHVWAEKFLNVGGNQLKLRKLKVWFDGNLNIQGEDGEIISADGGQTLNISKLRMSFSNAELLLGKIAPKHINLEGLNVDIRHELEGTFIAGFPLASTSDISDVPKEKIDPLSLIEYLNQEEGSSTYFKKFKTLTAKHVHLNIYDNVNLKSWTVQDAYVQFDRSFLQGEKLQIEGKFTRPGFLTVTPATLTFIHPKMSQKGNVQVMMNNVSSDLFDDYFPFENPIQARGDVVLNLEVLEDNSFENIYVKMAMKEGSIHVTPAYNFPFSFKGGDLEVGYDYLDDFVTLHNLSFVDTKGLPLEVSGTIADVTQVKEMKFNLSLVAQAPTTVSHIASYLPDRRIPGTVNWIRNNVHASHVENLRLRYTGKPSELPFCQKECGFDGTFDYQDMSLSFLKNTEAAEGLNGQFEMKDDYIRITSESGTVEQQKVKDLTAMITGHFVKNTQAGITLSGDISGPIDKLLNVIDKETGPEPWGIDVTGQHVSKGLVFIPFRDANLSSITYDFKADVANIETTNLIDGLAIQIPKGKIAYSHKKLHMRGEGTVNEIPVNFDWTENMQKPIQETVVSVWGELPNAQAMTYLKRAEIDVSGTISSTFNLKAKGQGQYDFEYIGDLSKNDVSHSSLAWHKSVGNPLSLKGTGVLGRGIETVSVDISATGQDLRLLGYLKLMEPVHADFKTFNIGKNELKVAITGQKLNFVGKQLDLSSLDFLKLAAEDKSTVAEGVSMTKTVSSTLDITVNVENVLLKKGVVENVVGELKQEDGQWRYIDIKAENNGDAFTVLLTYPSQDHMSVSFTSASVGKLLREANILNTFRKGDSNLYANIYTVNGKKEGQGFLRMKKTYMVNAPILAKLLSLISLTELLSNKDGIYFEDVEIPLLFVGNEIITDHAFLSGPSIGLRLRGKVNTVKDNVKIEGQLIPAEGLNSFISKIPLLGDLLTGSQSGLLVADFKVKGPISDPKVSANPLTFVMPGLVKDFFGTLFNQGDVTKPEK
jgi:hypothetical protein